MSHRVEVCTPAEAARYIRALGGEKALTSREEMLKGYVDIVCREADGSVAWEVHQPNIVTDFGRRAWTRGAFHVFYIITSPSAESPSIYRTTATDDGSASASQQTTPITPTYDANTLTKTWTTDTPFAAPASNRQIGFVGLTFTTKATSMASRLLAYTKLTPTRTQTTTQTLEVVYKITLTPLY